MYKIPFHIQLHLKTVFLRLAWRSSLLVYKFLRTNPGASHGIRIFRAKAWSSVQVPPTILILWGAWETPPVAKPTSCPPKSTPPTGPGTQQRALASCHVTTYSLRGREWSDTCGFRARPFNRADLSLPHFPSFPSGWMHMVNDHSSGGNKPRARPRHKVKKAGSPYCHVEESGHQPRTPRRGSWREQGGTFCVGVLTHF